MVKDIRKRQSYILGQAFIILKDQIEHIVITGKISGKRDSGRQREKVLDGLAN
jgi:hypothetical protein